MIGTKHLANDGTGFRFNSSCELFLGDIKVKALDANKVNKDEIAPNGDQVEVEDVVVVMANASVYPLAVVVKPIDALVADVAMSSLLRFQHFTSRADKTWFKVLVQLYKRDF